MRIPGKKRRGIVYTVVAVFIVIVFFVGLLWVMLSQALTTTKTEMVTTQYPHGVYNPTDLSLVTFGQYALPFLVFISAAIMLIIAVQRYRASAD